MQKIIKRQDITLEAALFLAQAAVKHDQELQCHISVVVMDSSGSIKVLLSMDKAGSFSTKTSEQKAYSALLGLSTKDLGLALESSAAQVRDSLLSTSQITLLPGGYPIMIKGELVGALGVGGATTDQDEACALSALQALGSIS